ncbi:RNase P subunit p30 [Dillenia turbinata]|uniref:RNase P subunit p30 n=1 Tax=Dillenia turbinata TaxID=194707 RepID=A0AAN8VB35_9MAGN
MGFFDFNIPYNEHSQSTNKSNPNKTVRLKQVIKAMELGYTGIAYNRTIKGVMSDSDYCTIPLLSFATLLKLAPFLSSSVNLHRQLLHIPPSCPFRQYTRLTVTVDSPPQSNALNSANPILKTYDLIAVKPLNQAAFDHACQFAEVDIIAIDFAKLPFRMKLPMIKAAIGRGIYFEIVYSPLIMEAERRQTISNAKSEFFVCNSKVVLSLCSVLSPAMGKGQLTWKAVIELLVDWTRGKNLIISSAAPSVNELRGPNDVANLCFLLGLSIEHAKAALSKNCRALIAHALRKRHYYKEAIRIEPVPSHKPLDSTKPWDVNFGTWDPISSGEGDLLLDDMAKSFVAASKASKSVKSIDFASIEDSLRSHGFQVKDYISRSDVLSQLPAKSTAGKFEVHDGEFQPPQENNFLPTPDQRPRTDASLVYEAPGVEDSLKPLPTAETVATIPVEEDFNISKKLDACTGPCEGAVQVLEAVNSVSDGERDVVLLEDSATIPMEVDVNNSNALELSVGPGEEEDENLKTVNNVSDSEVNHALSEDKVVISSLEDIGFAPTNKAPSEINSSDPFEDSIHLASADDDLKISSSFSMPVNMINVAGDETNAKDGDAMDVLLEPCTMSLANPMQGEVRNCSDHSALLGEEICFSEAKNEIVNGLAVANDELSGKLKEQEKEKLDESFFPRSGGYKRGRGRMPHHSLMFPARHSLNPVFFKRRAQKFRAKTKIL